jgi:hypothetical protein
MFGESLNPDTTLPAAGAFESRATYVGSETLSTAMEIRRENKRELASHPDEAGGSASILNLLATDSPRCESADTASLGCAFPGNQIGTGDRAWPTGQFSSNNWFQRKNPLEKSVNSI